MTLYIDLCTKRAIGSSRGLPILSISETKIVFFLLTAQKLAEILYRSAQEHAYINPNRVHQILGYSPKEAVAQSDEDGTYSEASEEEEFCSLGKVYGIHFISFSFLYNFVLSI